MPYNGGFNIVLLLVITWAAVPWRSDELFMIGHFWSKSSLLKSHKALYPEHLEKTQKFLDKHGHLAIFLGRFFPFIRIVCAFIAGKGGSALA